MSADIHKIIRLRRQVYVYDLDGADTIRSLTNEELSQIYNGIGPEWFPAELREAVNNLTPDLECCALVHDAEYSTGSYADINGPHSRYDFHEANRRLKANGYAIAKAKYCWLFHPLKFLALRAASRAYAKLCDRYGWDAWVEGHAKTAVNNQQTKGQTP